MAAAEGARKRIKELEVVLTEVRAETPDTATLVFFTGNDHLDYLAGHFCTIDPHQFRALERFTAYLEDQKGKREPPRAYSMSSAPHERGLAITVKEEQYTSGRTKYPPLLSPLLVAHLNVGTKMTITGFTGPYTLPPDIEARTDHLVHVVAGSGAVPNFAILKHALHEGLKLRHTFVCSNRTVADICFRDELHALARRYPDRVRLFHTVTREPEPVRLGPEIRAGRVTAELLKEAVGSPTECLVYVCGPAITVWDRHAARDAGTTPEPRFLETVLAHLGAIGVPDRHIKRESYG